MLELRVQAPKKRIDQGAIRHPDQRAIRIWMFRPDGAPAKVAVCQNMNNGVLRVHNGAVELSAEADAAGWRYAEPVVGAAAIAEADAWDEKCKATKGRLSVAPPKWIADALASTRIEDDEPPEGWGRLEAAEKKRERAQHTARAKSGKGDAA